MARAVGAARTGVRRGPVAAPDARRARRLPPRAWAPRCSARRRPRPGVDRASRARSARGHAVRRDDRPRWPSSRTPRWPTRSRSRSSAQPSHGGELRPARPRAGRRRRRDHPVERAARAASPHKIGPALLAGLHGRPQVVARGAGRGLPRRRGRRADRAPARRAQRAHRRPRGLGAARARDPRVDKITFTGSTAAGRKIASICGERIARVHPRARRQVGRGHPRRRRPRAGRRPDDRRGRVRDDRAGVLVADPHRRHA